MIDDLDEELLLAAFLPEIQARAEAALALWEAVPRKQDLAGYLFAKTDNPRPYLQVSIVPGGFELTIRGPQVEFFEDGNGPGVITPKRAKKLFLKLNAGGFLELDSVQPYEGEQPWFKSVEAAMIGL